MSFHLHTGSRARAPCQRAAIARRRRASAAARVRAHAPAAEAVVAALLFAAAVVVQRRIGIDVLQDRPPQAAVILVNPPCIAPAASHWRGGRPLARLAHRKEDVRTRGVERIAHDGIGSGRGPAGVVLQVADALRGIPASVLRLVPCAARPLQARRRAAGARRLAAHGVPAHHVPAAGHRRQRVGHRAHALREGGRIRHEVAGGVTPRSGGRGRAEGAGVAHRGRRRGRSHLTRTRAHMHTRCRALTQCSHRN